MGKKKKKDKNIEDGFNIETSCAVCNKCRKNEHGVCLFGGPFTGYSLKEEEIKENE